MNTKVKVPRIRAFYSIGRVFLFRGGCARHRSVAAGTRAAKIRISPEYFRTLPKVEIVEGLTREAPV